VAAVEADWMPNRHILLISQIPLWSMARTVGGPAFHRTLNALAERYRVTLVTPRLDYVDATDMPAGVELVDFDHRLHGLWRGVRKVGWLTDTLAWYTFQWSAWPAVKRVCDAGDVDLVYGYEIYGTPVAARAAAAFGMPCVARYQGTLMSQRKDMRMADLRFWKHVRALLSPADLYIMTNDGTHGDRYLIENGVPADRIRFWMNGADFSIADLPTRDVRPDVSIPPSSPLLLTVSRLSHWKRLDRALRVLAEVRDRDIDAHMIVVGTGPEEDALLRLARELDLSACAHFVGGVNRKELAAYYTSADVLLSLYDYSNLANPVIEAMVLGRPLIALDTGGTSDLVVDGVNGRLVPLAEEGKVASIAAGLLEDRQTADRLGDSAAIWARENLRGWDRRMDAELDELDALMAEPTS
jgi:glycosyltransferase involved in cell wall biosynthesis